MRCVLVTFEDGRVDLVQGPQDVVYAWLNSRAGIVTVEIHWRTRWIVRT